MTIKSVNDTDRADSPLLFQNLNLQGKSPAKDIGGFMQKKPENARPRLDILMGDEYVRRVISDICLALDWLGGLGSNQPSLA